MKSKDTEALILDCFLSNISWTASGSVHPQSLTNQLHYQTIIAGFL